MTTEGPDHLIMLREMKHRVGLGKTMIYRVIGRAFVQAVKDVAVCHGSRTCVSASVCSSARRHQ